ncbi:hypothetical protein A5692_27115 [Mycobacterium sp. E342]|uniref:hypothetical protein n=1 Tax=unclassified Mycobacterium TaxID=2642494 RepID=UPI0008011205|nr:MULTISPECIES: hypothetical protein [unclassified Mycobacterium]OBG98652.1 hypothetical protein A9X04_00125 [Mycobacterium sp. E3247]OBH25718.1 hypothetical protein A5692_27115 [Mycobacterium sp. E342]
MPGEHCEAARKVLADVDAELAASAVKYPRTRYTKTRIKLSAEIRQCDTAIMRLLKAIKTGLPQRGSQKTISVAPSGQRAMVRAPC